MIVGYAAGAFDLFHIGHLNILMQASRRCDRLIAGVVSDDLCESTKGVRPVIPLDERLEIVRHIDFVYDAVVEFHPNRLDTWADIGFDVFFKGDDWKDTPKGLKLERDFAGVGVKVEYFPYTTQTSSTALRSALASLAVNGRKTPLNSASKGL